MRLSKLSIKKINLNDIDKDYSAQDILLKLGELYQFESGIYGYGNIWNKLQRNIEDIIMDNLNEEASGNEEGEGEEEEEEEEEENEDGEEEDDTKIGV